MDVARRIFRVGECVYAKQKKFPPWPGTILALHGRRAKIRFFGWFEQWYVECKNEIFFLHSKQAVDQNRIFNSNIWCWRYTSKTL